MNDYPLILFAKVPEPGKVKTRLTPDLSFAEAAELAKVLLVETLELTRKHWSGKLVLAVWPNVKDDYIQNVYEQFNNIELIAQSSGDLGAKMLNAMEQVGYPCAVMGCDVPHLEGVVLEQAYERLAKGENIIGPTEDGGYYLLGLQSNRPELFAKQAWGETSVLGASFRVARQHNFQFSELATMVDIDHYADLAQASQKLKSLRRFIMS